MKYVYLMRNDESGRFKVGVSQDPTKRIEQLQTGNDGDIVLVESFSSKYPTKVETALQNSFSHTRKRGEWFDLDIEQVVKFISKCRQIEQNLEYLVSEGNEFI